MPERDYVIPVVAHRLFGQRLEFYPTHIARVLDPSQGTRRGTDEIEALFVPDAELAHTAGRTVHDYWQPAGIRFELVAIADHSIATDLANFLPREREHYVALAGKFNVRRALNLYLAKDLQGAWGRAFPVQPDEPDALPGYAYVADRFEEDDTRGPEQRWLADVITTAHELGHALGLIHRTEDDNLMFGYGTNERTTELLEPQLAVVEYYARRFHRSIYGPDSVPHLVEPGASQYPFF